MKDEWERGGLSERDTLFRPRLDWTLRSTMGSPRKQLATEPLHHAHRQTGLSEPAALQPAALQRRSALRRLRQRPEARCSKPWGAELRPGDGCIETSQASALKAPEVEYCMAQVDQKAKAAVGGRQGGSPDVGKVVPERRSLAGARRSVWFMSAPPRAIHPNG